MKVLWFILGATIAVFAVFGFMALILSYCLSELSAPTGLPALDWWRSFCLLTGLGVCGAALSTSLGAAVRRGKD